MRHGGGAMNCNGIMSNFLTAAYISNLNHGRTSHSAHAWNLVNRHRPTIHCPTISMGGCLSASPPAAPTTVVPPLAAPTTVVPPLAAPTPTTEERLMATTLGQDFTFAGMRFLAKVVDYYDGDTVRVIFEFGGRILQYKARMAGYDSPEMKPLKTNPNREIEKAAAQEARASLIAKIGGALVYIECGDFDKYGRILVTVYLRAGQENGENVNTWMVENGHGTTYGGGKKAPFAAPAEES